MMLAHSTHDIVLPDGRSTHAAVGSGLAADAGSYSLLAGRRIFLAFDRAVEKTAAHAAAAALGDAVVGRHAIEGAEASKSWQGAEQLCESMAAAGIERSDAVVAIGGGVTTDLAGFAAGIYLRGIAAAYVPTTLLAQVDAAVGGKTGINLAAGKNLAGVFRQPLVAIIDVATLRTLPAQHWSAGMAEVVKHALLNASLWEMLGALLERSCPHEMADQDLCDLVARNIRCKAAIVAADEHEHGSRALLNLGHTFAHALEAAFGYAGITHGEAVALGLIAACRLSARLGLASAELEDEARAMLKRSSHPDHPLPEVWPAHDRTVFWAALERDKKRARHPRFVLPRAPGDVFVHQDPIERSEVDAVIDSLQQPAT